MDLDEQNVSTALNKAMPTVTCACYSSDSDDHVCKNGALSISASSTNTSIESSGDEVSKEEDKLNECHIFMKTHVGNLFDSSIQITNTDKQKFGCLCQTGEGREAFAKYVDNHRSCSMQVDENTFYKLAHSFALVLFECAEADDFLPSKILMNMVFTYYHYPKGSSVQFDFIPGDSVELKGPNLKEFTVELSGSEGESEETKISLKKFRNKSCKSVKDQKHVKKEKDSIWKAANNWFKDLSTSKPIFKSQDKGKSIDQMNHKEKSCEKSNLDKDLVDENIACKKYGNGEHANLKLSASDTTNNKKVYLYQALRRQTIWQSLRFWNAAFFDAVNAERQNYSSKLKWNSLSPEERESADEYVRNITFGKLVSFIDNMKHLGIGQDTCLQFLRKQSVIGNLNKDLYQMLRSQIEKPMPSET